MARRTQSVTIVVPADYLEDARCALAAEIAESSNALKSDPTEFAFSARILRKDVHLLDQLVDAVGDTELTAEHDGTSAPLVQMLEAMCRLVVERLRDQMQYGPLDVPVVLDLTARLKWAAGEVLRLEPALDPATWGEAAA